jgi:hypothetical protein
MGIANFHSATLAYVTNIGITAIFPFSLEEWLAGVFGRWGFGECRCGFDCQAIVSVCHGRLAESSVEVLGLVV